jgi:putative ABC transport system substrate-binding protein
MKRREFIMSAGAAAMCWPRRVHAQQTGRVPLVMLWAGGRSDDPDVQRRAAAFRTALQELGWIEGRNVRIENRWTSSPLRVTESDAAAMIAPGPDVIVTTGAPILALVHRQTRAIPVVFTLVTDPVSDGFVTSLARPGGNVTGFTIFEHSFAGKWLEMLKEVVPTMTRVAVMQNPDHPAWNAYLRAAGEIASRMGVEVVPAPVNNPAEIEAALVAFGARPNGGLLVLPSGLSTTHRAAVADAALRLRLPSIASLKIYAASGGLMSYGVVMTEPYQQAATYVDRILKGAKPGDLPVQAASKFEMVINLKTAKALGITVPATMLGRADEVIE